MSSEVSKICFFKFLTALFCCASCIQLDVRAMIKRSPSMYMIDNPADSASAESPPATSNSEEGNPWETEDSSAVPRDSQYFVEEIDNLARFFEIYYDDYYKRIVIDMSYPSLLSNQLKKACSSNNEVLKSNLERVENLGDDWEAAKSLVLAIFSIKSTEKSDCIEGLLKSLWEDKTGRQRLKSFMLLQLIYPDGFGPPECVGGQWRRIKTISLYLEFPEEYKGPNGSAGCFHSGTNSVHLVDERFVKAYNREGTRIDAEKQEAQAKKGLITTLLHELTHAYHCCFFPYDSVGEEFKIPRDSIFGKKLFLQETLEGLLVVMKQSITAVDEQLNINRDSAQVEELAAKILKEVWLFPENFEWVNREELLTVTGIFPIDLLLFSLIDGSPKIFKFLITDRQNHSSGGRRIFNVERVSYNPPRTFRSEEDSLKRLIASLKKNYSNKLSPEEIEKAFTPFIGKFKSNLPSGGHVRDEDWKEPPYQTSMLSQEVIDMLKINCDIYLRDMCRYLIENNAKYVLLNYSYLEPDIRTKLGQPLVKKIMDLRTPDLIRELKDFYGIDISDMQ